MSTLSIINSFFGLRTNIYDYKYYKFSNFNFEKVQHVLRQFTTPIKEYGAQQLCDNVFPEFNGKILREKIPSNSDVDSFDAYEVSHYEKKKSCQMRFIDLIILNKVLAYTTSLFESLDSYYSINDYRACIDVLPKDTSSCYPRYQKKGTEDNINAVINEMTFFDSMIRLDKKILYLQQFPTTIFHRFTAKMKEDRRLKGFYNVSYKIRQIFGVSHFICALEVKYLTYFVNNFKRSLKGICTLGLTRPEVSNLVSRIRDKSIKTDRVVMCGDIRGCDKSIPAHFHRILFDTIAGSSPNEYIKNAILSLGNYLCFTPILRKDKINFTHGSTTSGSWITSIFNTFVIYSVICYSYNVLYNRFPTKDEVLVQGDDFICVIEEEDEKQIQEIFLLFNLHIKLSNSLISKGKDDIEFLGFLWDCRNTPRQLNSWVYVRTVYPERTVEEAGVDRIISRYLSLIFQLNNSNELFKRFLKYDKYLRDKCQNQSNPVFKIIDSMGRMVTQVFPIIYFLSVGWRAF